MKNIASTKTKITTKLKNVASSLVMIGLFSMNGLAHAQLAGATTALTTFRTQLQTICPIVGSIALIIIGVMYMKKMASNDTLFKWFIGALLVGVASPLALFLMPTPTT
jgi:type IV secretory pathway VirB2 component (pilin)